jgi:DNA-binding NarL/FixJ family response regulator
MTPLNIFVASKSSILQNYIYLFIKEFSYNLDFKLAIEISKKTDLVIIDTDSISANESAKFMGEFPVILFARNIRPYLINYTSKYEINGVISFNMEQEGIAKTFDEALKGEIYFNEEMISILFSPQMNDLSTKVLSITPRELDIIKLMLYDQTNEEIANNLGLSVSTVNAHKGNIMRKIGAKTTAGMIKIILDYTPRIG